MAKLLIFRGEKKLDERELTEQTLRIGRAPQNDLVLEDPGKGVSRNHAEIRFAGGRYTLVDLESQNGIWVSGTRVPSILLEPGVSAALGPFRLMVEKPAVGDTAPMAAPQPAETTTELTLLSERSAAPLVLDLDKVAPPPAKPPVPGPVPVSSAPGPAPSSAVKASPAPKRDKVPPPPVPKPVVQERPWYADTRVQIGMVAALLLVVASAIVGYRAMHKQPLPPVWDIKVAQALIASGKCQEALDTQINPALQADPANQQAIALRDGCNAPPPPPPVASTSSIPPVPTIEERLDGAETLLAANLASDCQTALVSINEVLAEDGANERAKALSGRANACINPPRPVQTAVVDKPAVIVPPSSGGLEIIQGETDKAYKTRMGVTRKKYEDALAVLAAQRYVQAMRLLDDLVSEVPVGYLDLAQRRDEARSGIRAEAKSVLESAQAAEKRNDYDGAVEQYRRAHQLDPSLQVDASVQRVNEAKLARGLARCNQGLTDAAYEGNNPAVIAALQEAIRLLPPADPCAVKARAALAKAK